MSFGAVAVDSRRPTDILPGRSFLTGLFGNALGWRWQDAQNLQDLQQRIEYAAALTRRGNILQEYQTHAFDTAAVAWTTRGKPEKRERRGGPDTMRTELRHLEYLANAQVVVAVRLNSPQQSPTLEEIQAALAAPARTLYIGRKCCLPSVPMGRKTVNAADCLDALPGEDIPLAAQVRWTEDIDHPSVRRERSDWISDHKEWESRLHTGRNIIHHGTWQEITNEDLDHA